MHLSVSLAYLQPRECYDKIAKVIGSGNLEADVKVWPMGFQENEAWTVIWRVCSTLEIVLISQEQGWQNPCAPFLWFHCGDRTQGFDSNHSTRENCLTKKELHNVSDKLTFAVELVRISLREIFWLHMKYTYFIKFFYLKWKVRHEILSSFMAMNNTLTRNSTRAIIQVSVWKVWI